jgi:hypothetical protein
MLCAHIRRFKNFPAPTVRFDLIADNLSKAGWSLAVSQLSIPTGERSGLQTRIAVTESGSLCVRMKS